MASRGAARALGEYVSAYVPLDIDAELRERLLAGGFVLLVGDSTAGKTRATFETVNALLAGLPDEQRGCRGCGDQRGRG